MSVTISEHLPRQLSRVARGRSRAAPAAGPVTADPTDPTGTPARRVRHEVRDGIVVAAFSATASTGLALALLLLVRVAG